MFERYAANRKSEQEKKEKTVIAGMMHDTKTLKMMAVEHEMMESSTSWLVQKHLEKVVK